MYQSYQKQFILHTLQYLFGNEALARRLPRVRKVVGSITCRGCTGLYCTNEVQGVMPVMGAGNCQSIGFIESDFTVAGFGTWTHKQR